MKLSPSMILSLRNIDGSRKLFFLVGLTAVLAGVFFFATSQLILSYRAASEIAAQKAEMHETIQKFQSHVDFLDQQKYRPIPKDKLGDVQTDLLYQAQAHSLNLLSLKVLPSDNKNPNVYSYSMTLAGPYQNVVDYLRSFHSRDALLNIVQLQLQPKEGLIDATVTYRVYTKG